MLLRYDQVGLLVLSSLSLIQLAICRFRLCYLFTYMYLHTPLVVHKVHRKPPKKYISLENPIKHIHKTKSSPSDPHHRPTTTQIPRHKLGTSRTRGHQVDSRRTHDSVVVVKHARARSTHQPHAASGHRRLQSSATPHHATYM